MYFSSKNLYESDFTASKLDPTGYLTVKYMPNAFGNTIAQKCGEKSTVVHWLFTNVAGQQNYPCMHVQHVRVYCRENDCLSNVINDGTEPVADFFRGRMDRRFARRHER